VNEESDTSEALGSQQNAVTTPGLIERAGERVLDRAAERLRQFPVTSPKHPHHPDNLRVRAAAERKVLAVPTPQETLQQYAARCEDATGVKVPSFSCENGVEVQVGTAKIDLADQAIGTGSIGSRFLPNPTSQILQRMRARGGDIYGQNDQFYFSNITSVPLNNWDPEVPLSGDGTIEVYVKSLTNTHEYAKAGVMFRASTASNSANVAMLVTPTRGVSFQRRLTNNAAQTFTNESANWRAPLWLRLTRTGNSFAGYVSYDRVAWTQVGPSVSVSAIPTAPLAGLAACSHTTSGAEVEAWFDKFQWTAANTFTCDRPNALNDACDPGSTFQILQQTGDATVVANCRKEGYGPGRWGDVAIIQYNKKTGGMCVYQTLPMDRDLNPIGDGNGIPGMNIPAPAVTSTAPNFRWYTTTETLDVGCPKCHDNGGFIRSPYLTQTGLLPNWQQGFDNVQNPVNWVGLDFTQERSWSITANDSFCSACHRLAVNNHAGDRGTAYWFAEYATSDVGLGAGAIPLPVRKNQHSVTAPIWMIPGQITYDPDTRDNALVMKNCANEQWFGRSGSYWTTPHSVPGCSYTALGNRWWDVSFNDLQIGVTNGGRTQSGTEHTITNRGTDIYGTSDQFQYALMGAEEDGMLQVKVNSLTNTHQYAKAGLMFRNGISTGAEHVMVHITPGTAGQPGAGAQFQYRAGPVNGVTQSVVASTPLAPRNAPVWLRLYKAGNLFSGWVSNDNVTYNQVAAPVALALTGGVTTLIHGGMAVTSHNVNQTATGVFDRFSWIPSQHNLMDTNIGVLNGYQTLSGGDRVITVAGNDIYGNSDQFFYSFKRIDSANAVITAKVNSLVNTHAYAKAGLMIRTGIGTGARHVMVHFTPSGAQFQVRSTENGTVPEPSTNASWTAPNWLKLERSGTTFTGSASIDGETWTQIGTISNLNLPNSALIGLAVTSHHATAATTARFSNVIVP
jgi:hypothetical protein